MNYDLIVIGSGPGGYVAAIRAAQLGLNVACIDKRKELGGTCLNVGCIPSKALLHSTEHMDLSFIQMMNRKAKIVSSFNDGISQLFKKNKITFIPGAAQFTSPTTLQVNGETHTAKNFIIASGSEPTQLPFLPFDEKRIVSSTGALSLSKIPEKLLIIGAGVIGVELGSVYARLGSKVTFIEFMDRICPTIDTALSNELQKVLTAQGMTFHLSTKVTGADITPTSITLRTDKEPHTADVVLVAVGRRPNTQGLNLAAAGITLSPKGTVVINSRFQTTTPHIYAIGDIVDGPMLAHKASEEGVAAAEIIAGYAPAVHYIAIPSVVYTTPEVASVGLTESEVKALGLTPKIGQFPFKINSRAKCTDELDGFVKIIADSATDKLLGMHLIGAHASELITIGSLCLQNGLTATQLAHTPFPHPTLSEAIKEAALDVSRRAVHK